MAAVTSRVGNDGLCRFRTVQEAIDAVPLQNRVRRIIEVCPGVYKEPVYVPKTKNFITLRGFCPEETIITWGNTSTRINHHQDSRIIGTGTFGCGTFIVEGEHFIAENVTFENSSPQGSGQAVAMRVTADHCGFYNCRFLGWQDTLYLHFGKQYLRDCYIEGSVDFIFGNSTALLEHCHIHCKSPGFITAQSRKSPQELTGYVFLRYGRVWHANKLIGRYKLHLHLHKGENILYETDQAGCLVGLLDLRTQWSLQPGYLLAYLLVLDIILDGCIITGNGEGSYTYLGRPWGPCARVVFAYTWMDACIKPAGWDNWNKAENERSACFYEYRCSGAGSSRPKRVPWARELVDDEATQFLAHSFIDPDPQRSWLLNKITMKIPLSA